jgi:predicted RNA methylase
VADLRPYKLSDLEPGTEAPATAPKKLSAVSPPDFPKESPAERRTAAARQVALMESEPAHDDPEAEAARQRELTRHRKLAGGEKADMKTIYTDDTGKVTKVEGGPKKIPKWKEISSNPKFQALDEPGKESVRLDYWQNYVSPQFSTDELDSARRDFDELTKPTLTQRAKKFATDIAGTVANKVVEAATPEPAPATLMPPGQADQPTDEQLAAAPAGPARMTLTPGGQPQATTDAAQRAELVQEPPASPLQQWAEVLKPAEPKPRLPKGSQHGATIETAGGNTAELQQRAEAEKAGDIASRDYWRNVGNSIKNVPDQWKQIMGGTLQALGEGFQVKDTADKRNAAWNETMQEVARMGADFYSSAAEDQERSTRIAGTTLKPSLGAEATGSAIQSLAQMLPALGLSGGSAARVITFMSGETGAQSYGKARDEGLEPGQAALYALLQGTIEGATEYAPIHALLAKAPVSARRQFYNFLVREVPGEMLATTLQDGVDKLSVNPGMTWSDFLHDLGITALSTPLAAGVQTAAARAGGAGRGEPEPTQGVDLSDPAAMSRRVAGETTAPAAQEPGSDALEAEDVRGREEPSGGPAEAPTGPDIDGRVEPVTAEPAPAAAPKKTAQPADNKPEKQAGGAAKKAVRGAAKAEKVPPSATPSAPAGEAPISTQLAPEKKPVVAVENVQASEPAKETPAPSAEASQPISAQIAPGGTELGGAAAGLKKIFESPVDEKAHAAATSPHNELEEPTEPQKKAGNYQKGHVRIGGLDISIENPAGSERKGVEASGKPWSVTMKDHYGYVRGTVGKDKDHIDIFVKAGTPAELPNDSSVFIVDQKKPGNGHFDEHKVMLGYDSQAEAEKAYKANYSKGWDGIRAISELTLEEFHDWLDSSDTTLPYEAKTHADMASYVESEIARGRMNATLLTDKSIEEFSKILEARGWEKRGSGKSVIHVKGEHEIWVRSQGPDAHPIVQWSVHKEDGGKGLSDLEQATKDRGRQGSLDFKAIGTNSKGETLYQDTKGVRSIVRDGVRITESVGLRPTRGAGGGVEYVPEVEHKGEYLTKEEHDAVPKQGADEGSVRRAPGAGDEGKSPRVGARDTGHKEPARAQDGREKAAGGTEAPVRGEELSRDQVATITEAARDKLLQPHGFKTITEARAWGSERIGRAIKPGTIAAKQFDEALEAAIVYGARKLIAKGRADGYTDHEIFGVLRSFYERQPNLNVRTSTSIEQQAYSTPAPLAFIASRLAGINATTRVLEPTAGNGMLLIEADPDHAVANELNDDRASALRAQGFITTQIDATALPTMEPVDAVLANPPFGYVKGKDDRNREWPVTTWRASQPVYTTNQIDHAIAMRALEAMKEGGRAVLIVGAPKEGKVDGYDAAAKRAFYFTLYRDYNVVDHFTVQGDLYAKQGAAWPVDVIVIHGRGKSALRLPQAVKPKEYGSWDALTEKLNAAATGSDREQGPRAPAEGAGERPAAAPAGSSTRPSGSRARRPHGERPTESGGARPDRVEPSPSGLDAGARGEHGERPAGGVVRGSDQPASAGVPGQLDAGAVFDEEFSKLFGDLDKAPARGAVQQISKEAWLDIVDEAEGRGTSPALAHARSAAKEAASGLGDVAKGLAELFGGNGKLGSGPTFDENTYAKAKPYFVEGVKHFKQAAADIRELVRLLLTELRTKFAMTAEAIHRMKPYVVRFIQEVQSGAVKIWDAQLKQGTRPQEQETEHQRAYTPKSAANSIGSLVPANMQGPTQESLDQLEKKVGNLDQFVAAELDYKVADLPKFFSAEQVDALALALDSMKRGSGFIIGDQTGIGKGRVNAGIIRWAIRNNKTPIFVTEKPNLYGDIMRDLADIDMPGVRAVMTNNNADVPMDDEAALFWAEHEADAERARAAGEKPPRMPAVEERPGKWMKTTRQEKTLKELMAAGSLGDNDVIFTTYNQMQTVEGKNPPRHDFLREFARGAVVLFDESHNAGGTEEKEAGPEDKTPKRSDFARALLAGASSVFYSSATYAKRPG